MAYRSGQSAELGPISLPLELSRNQEAEHVTGDVG